MDLERRFQYAMTITLTNVLFREPLSNKRTF